MNGYRGRKIRNITITSEILRLIAAIDEFKGRWKAMESPATEKLTSLRRIATLESLGSSTRIEGEKRSNREVEKLLFGVKAKSLCICENCPAIATCCKSASDAAHVTR